MSEKRELSRQEEKLLELLIAKANLNLPSSQWKNMLTVQPMNDGKMGSIKLYPKGSENKKRVFGHQASEYKFIDADGVEVIASLNLDKEGDLFELDIWKTNFAPLIRIPNDL